MSIGDEIRDELARGLQDLFDACKRENKECSCAQKGDWPCGKATEAFLKKK